MEDVALKIFYVLLSFCSMEFVARFTHKYIMHGFLWKLHEDHHTYKKSKDSQRFQKNDAFFAIFASPGASLMIFGSYHNFNVFFWIGLGIALYGLAYIFIHEIYIHRRFRWSIKIKNPYFEAIRRAHIDHHKFTKKSPGVNYGLLLVPKSYFSDKKKMSSKK